MAATTEHKAQYEAIDASWQPDSKAQFSLLLHDAGFSEVVFDARKHKFVAVRTWQEEFPLRSLASHKEEYLLFPENTYRLFLSSPQVTLIPSALYKAEDAKVLFEVNHKLQEGNTILSSVVKSLGAQLLFAVSKEEQELSSNISNEALAHSAACWLEMLCQQHKNNNRTILHADVDKEHIGIAVFIEGTLQFYNCFPAATEEDKLYFLMFVSEQLRINPHRDTYCMSGHIFKHDELYSLLIKYIKELHFESRPKQYHYALPLHNIPEHFYFKAYSTPLCEL
jgi:hypothetical protein